MKNITQEVAKEASKLSEELEKDLQVLENDLEEEEDIDPYYDYKVKSDLFFETLLETLKRPSEWEFLDYKTIRHLKTDIEVQAVSDVKATVTHPDFVELTDGEMFKLKDGYNECRSVMKNVKRAQLFDKLNDCAK